MKQLAFTTALVFVGLVCMGVNESSAQDETGKEKILWAPEDLQWKPLAGAPPGVMSVLLWGDDTEGEYGGFTKFPAGFKAPLHYHTYETKIVVIKGAYTHNGKPYGPGSYLSIPGGDIHTTDGAWDSETVFLILQPGTFDLNVVDPPAEKE